jgi:heterodisulfide reductase subunit A
VQIRHESQDGEGVATAPHDLVVLALGMLPEWKPEGVCAVSRADDGFLKTVSPKMAPTLTDLEGVFVAGAAAGPKDIVDSIAEAGAAAMEASKYMNLKLKAAKKAAA